MRRTDDLVRRIVSEAILTKLQDPRIGFVSVTGVRISKEFDTAKVYVSVLGDEAARKETLTGLRSAAPYLQSQLARGLRMRRIPRLRFIYDDSVDRGFRVDATLRDLETDLPLDSEPATDDGPQQDSDSPAGPDSEGAKE
jgi:ribosome-binding factor A